MIFLCNRYAQKVLFERMFVIPATHNIKVNDFYSLLRKEKGFVINENSLRHERIAF